MDGRDVIETDLFRQHLDEAAGWIGSVWKQRQVQFLRFFPNHCESPIEGVFLLWWSALGRVHYINENLIELVPQHEVEAGGQRYRLDFAALAPSMVQQAAEKWAVPRRGVAIELDGHEFHEKTKEQVAYRNQRDRHLISAGWEVIRFSGSELHRRPIECVHQAAQHALRVSGALRQAVIDKGGYEDIYEA
jgi:hypothetical protein